MKPAVLSCFGDIALAIGGNFVKYLPSTLQMLEQAARTRVSCDDDELVEYMTALHEGILEAYIGVVQGLVRASFLFAFSEDHCVCLSQCHVATSRTHTG